MSEEELTPWFPPEIKPVRKGIYERDWDGEVCLAYWNGKRFNSSYGIETTREFAMRMAIADRMAGAKNKRWRGLAKEPK